MFPNNSSVTRPLPSLLPGSDGTPSPVFYRYYAAAKTAVVVHLTLRLFGVESGGLIFDFAGSLTGAGKSAAQVPGCCSPVSPVPVFGLKEAYGSPKFPGNPNVPLLCSQTPAEP